MPEKYEGEYARALAWLHDSADLAALARDRESQFAVLGLAEDLLQRLHWAFVSLKHQPVDDTMPIAIQAVREKLQAEPLDARTDSALGLNRASVSASRPTCGEHETRTPPTRSRCGRRRGREQARPRALPGRTSFVLPRSR